MQQRQSVNLQERVRHGFVNLARMWYAEASNYSMHSHISCVRSCLQIFRHASKYFGMTAPVANVVLRFQSLTWRYHSLLMGLNAVRAARILSVISSAMLALSFALASNTSCDLTSGNLSPDWVLSSCEPSCLKCFFGLLREYLPRNVRSAAIDPKLVLNP